jgi:hypothetical protein
MSNLSVNTITNAAGGNTAQINGMTPTADSLQGFRNRLINSDMRIDQRNAGASVTQTTGDLFPVDRFRITGSVTSKFTGQRSTTAPAGFVNSLLLTSSAATSLAAGDYYVSTQKIEGFNIADLGWGTASAVTVTLSFWVRSSLTGTFGGAILNGAANRSYPFTFVVNSADTFEYKTVTIAGDTSGTWATDNSTGMFVNFGLGVGSTYSGTAGAWAGAFYFSATGATSVVGTSGATFYITGVQLEAGSVATPFERRPFGTELQLCQRYFQTSFPIGTAPAQNAGGTGAIYFESPAGSAPASCQVVFPVQMRTTPSTFTTFNPSAANANWRNITASSDITVGLYSSSATGAFINSSAQVMNQYAIAAIQYSASAEL